MANPGKRRTRARRAVLQALYQWQLSGQTPNEVEAQFVAEQPLEHVDVDYFQLLLRNIPIHIVELDDVLSPSLDRPVSQLDPIEKAILRIGAFELVHRPEVPWRVVINEAVELAKSFGAEQSHKYVNGILDKLAHQQRSAEINRH